MKILFLLLSFILSGNMKPVAHVSASSYILLEATNKEVLEGRNIHEVRSVASVSKIMTALISLESGRLFEVVEVPADVLKTYGSSCYYKVGEQSTILDLVYGLLLRSGNDAALTLALALGKTVDGFSLLMNTRAQEIGMKNSSFNNPSGLDVDEIGNLSTAYDLSLLMSEALKNPLFLQIIGTKHYKHPKGSWQNKNKLLFRYDKLLGGKTGFTYKARRTLVTAAKEGELYLIAVTLNSGNDFNEHQRLYEETFSKFTFVLFLKPGKQMIAGYEFTSKNRVGILVEKDEIPGGIMIYKIDKSGHLLELQLVTKTQKTYEVNFS